VAANLANNLAAPAEALLPELKALRVELAAQPGVHKVLLSGSGSTLFGICESEAAADAAAAFFSAGASKPRPYWACAVRSL